MAEYEDKRKISIIFSNFGKAIDGNKIEDVIEIFKVEERRAINKGYENIKIILGMNIDYDGNDYPDVYLEGTRLETDKEVKQREMLLENSRKRRYGTYLRLKEEFKNMEGI